jgi:prefoldin alpha subunit
VEDLGANLKDLEAIVQGKSNNLRVVEEGKLCPLREVFSRTDISSSTTAEGSQQQHNMTLYTQRN